MNQFQEIFDKQKAYFDSDATKSYEWRIDQLTRLENLCNENAEALEAAMSSDFKTASQEKVFEIMAPVGTAAFAKLELKEWMKPVDVVVPKALRESGHTAKVYREPYGVTLVIGPFNGPLTLLFDPAVQVIAAGNPCILKLSEGLPATSKVLLDLIPKYFDPRAVTAVTGSKDEVTELAQAAIRLHLLHRERQGWQDRHGGGRKESDSCTPRTWRTESSLRRCDRQYPGCSQEDCLGCDGLGRPMVYLPRIRLRA